MEDMLKDKIKVKPGEVLWCLCNTDGGKMYAITSKITRDMYFLYLVEDLRCKTLVSKSKNPLDFDNLIYKTEENPTKRTKTREMRGAGVL